MLKQVIEVQNRVLTRDRAIDQIDLRKAAKSEGSTSISSLRGLKGVNPCAACSTWIRRISVIGKRPYLAEGWW